MKCLFCDFIQGKRTKHTNGLPFQILHSTQKSVSFLAIDIPATADGHILVMPKRHYAAFEDMPPQAVLDLMKHVMFILKKIRKTNDGYNILLNEGRSAGQTVLHPHFHIIPRRKGDNIEFEVWKPKKLTKEGFQKLQDNYRKMLLPIY